MLALLLAGCSFNTKPKPKDNRTGQARLIGVVEMVNPEQGYVLIQCPDKSTLKSGTELIGLDHTGAKSRLLVTPERKANYLTADIKEGTPIIGALVLQKVKEGDELPEPPKPGESPADALAAAGPDLSVMPGERPPPIPEIVFPSQGAAPTLQPVPVPSINQTPAPAEKPKEPEADLSKLPPVIR
jgi:hypothetical protein